jgi:hypothetical protein
LENYHGKGWESNLARVSNEKHETEKVGSENIGKGIADSEGLDPQPQPCAVKVPQEAKT